MKMIKFLLFTMVFLSAVPASAVTVSLTGNRGGLESSWSFTDTAGDTSGTCPPRPVAVCIRGDRFVGGVRKTQGLVTNPDSFSARDGSTPPFHAVVYLW